MGRKFMWRTLLLSIAVVGLGVSVISPETTVIAQVSEMKSRPADAMAGSDSDVQSLTSSVEGRRSNVERFPSTALAAVNNVIAMGTGRSLLALPRLKTGNNSIDLSNLKYNPFPFNRSAMDQDPIRRERPGVIDAYIMAEYRRDEMKFTGNPTRTFVFNAAPGNFFVPNPQFQVVPGAFEPNDEQMIGYASVGLKDYGFDRLRLDTRASFRYIADIDRQTAASPFLNIINSFHGFRDPQVLSLYTDMIGILSDDRETRFSVRVGRQFIYGAETVHVDGVTLSFSHPRFELDVFGGRRSTFYSDTEERAIVGQNFLARITPRTIFRYDFLHYVQNSHRFQVRHGIGESWFIESNFFLLDRSAVDLTVGAHYFPGDGKTRISFNALQKLSSSDFIYDYTFRALARNPENRIRRIFFPLPVPRQTENAQTRLNLLPIHPYTQFYFDIYRNLTDKVGVGGSFWIRGMNHDRDEGAFNNSFQEFRANADYLPWRGVEFGGEYRYRHVSHSNPEQARFFFDIRREGETAFHEIYGTASYRFPDDRLALEGGIFYRRFNTQSRLISLKGLDATGFIGGVAWRITNNYKVRFEYGIDDEMPFFNPDIKYTQSFRVRFEWRFSR